MRTLVIAIAIVCSTIGLSQAQSAEEKKEEVVKVKTSAICEMCQYAIEKALVYEKGVKIASLDLETKEVTIKYNPKKTSPETLRQRISLTGYHADDVKRDPKAYEDLPNCCKDGAHQNE